MKAERIQLEDLPVYDIKSKKVLEGGIGGRVLTARIYTAHYNRKLMDAKRIIRDTLKKEGIDLYRKKEPERISLYLTMFDFQRPVELSLNDYIVALYEKKQITEPKKEHKRIRPVKKKKPRSEKDEIPQWKQEYLDYLKSTKWREFRLKALEYFGNECGLCASTHDLQIHHKHYKNLYNETFKDVIPLCRKCHKKHHDK